MLSEIVIAVLIAVRINSCHGLQCYSCTDTRNPALCRSTTTCSAGQACFEESRPTQSGRMYSMGCLDIQVCAAIQTHTLIGRSTGKRQNAMCHQCCSADNCNINLCSAPSHTGSGSFLLVKDGSFLYQIDVATNMVHQVNLQVSSPYGYDYDYIDKKVYWFDPSYFKFFRQLIHSSQNVREEWIQSSVYTYSNHHELAVDPISRLLFFIRSIPTEIVAMSLDTGYRVSVIDTGLSNPNDLKLDPKERQIYWTDISRQTIEAANYNGSNRRTLVSGLQRPTALALDETHNIIYWTDAGNHKIEKANTDGTNRQTVAIIKGTDYTGLALLGNDLFYTSAQRPYVMKISTSGGTPQPFGKSDFSQLVNIKAYNMAILPIDSNACTIRNGGCSHVCIPTSVSTRECRCPIGYRLSADAASCVYTTLVRLAGSNATTWQGRIEYSVDNGATWNTFCTTFHDNDANVLCKMLGLEGQDAQIITEYSIFGSGNSSFGTFNTPACIGTEDSITDCRYFSNTFPCSHSNDQAVNCSRAGKMRLAGSNAKDQGRVEILMNSQWGTICDDNFGPSEAAVVCGSLGYSRSGAVIKRSYYFGQGSTSSPIHLDDVKCIGNENSLLKCQHNKVVDVSNCQHKEDVGLICQAATFTNVRLVGSSAGPNQGTVELSTDAGKTWNTICDDYFGEQEAQVVCSMLGFNRIGAIAKTNAYFGQGNSSSKTLQFDCYGSETSVLHCSIPSTGTCSHSEDAGVVCPYSKTEQLRLVNGPSSNQGRIEMSLDNGATWGTVCGGLDKGAGVVCAALGYPREGAIYKSYNVYGQGSSSQPILLHYPTCDGMETSLLDCKRSTSTCSHTDDVGVMCLAEPTTLVRLDNYKFTKGRVELSIDNGTTWGTICNDYFGEAEAKVICRMLGFYDLGGVAVTNGSYGAGLGQILFDDLNCSGEETSLLQCKHKPIGENDCTHDEDVGVACNYIAQGTAEVRLTGSSSRYQGRVEVKLQSTRTWGTICSYDFDFYEASVICAMLGFQRTKRIVYFGSIFTG